MYIATSLILPLPTTDILIKYDLGCSFAIDILIYVRSSKDGFAREVLDFLLDTSQVLFMLWYEDVFTLL